MVEAAAAIAEAAPLLPSHGPLGLVRRALPPLGAAAGLGAHQLTGSPVPDAAGSILVGVLLGVVAIILINRNLRFLVGQEVDPRVRAATLQALMAAPEVARVTYLRMEIVGPRTVSVIGDVDLTGDVRVGFEVTVRILPCRNSPPRLYSPAVVTRRKRLP